MKVEIIVLFIIIVIMALTPIIHASSEGLISSITLLGLQTPQGQYLAELRWGKEEVRQEFQSSGEPKDLELKIPLANIRAPIQLTIRRASSPADTLFEAVLVPSPSGYRLVKVVMGDVNVQGIRVSELLSLVAIKIQLLGVEDEDIEGVNLYVGNETMTPTIQRGHGSIAINVPLVVIDPGKTIEIDLRIEKPSINFKGHLLLVGEKLVAGGICDGALTGGLMLIEHIFGLVSFHIDMPSLGPALQKEVSRSSTEILIRRGLPQGFRATITLFVRDTEGVPVEGAVIMYRGVNATKGKVVTDIHGVAVIDNIDETSLEIEVIKHGFKRVHKKVDVLSTNMRLDIVLERERTFIDEMRDAIRSLKEFSFTITVVGIVILVLGLLRMRKVMLALGMAMVAIGILSHVVG